AFGIQLFAQLVEIGHLLPGAEADFPGIRRQLTEHDLDQRRFAGAVGADQPDAVAAQDAQVEIPDQRPAVKALADAGQFGNQPARPPAGIHGQPAVADALAPCGALGTQPLQPPHPALVARAPRLYALAYPRLLLRPEFVEPAVRLLFLGKLAGLACFIS